MKTLILHFLALVSVLPAIGEAQIRRPDLPSEQRDRVEAIRDARRQRIHAERIDHRQQARESGRAEARANRTRDREFVAVWNGLTPEVRKMYAARELAERISSRPAWKDQTRAERIAAVTDFITNYPSISAARPLAEMDVALEKPDASFPEPQDLKTVLRVVSAVAGEIPALKKAGDPVDLAISSQTPDIDAFPQAEVPDLFTINRRFTWKKPHGQWMNQMLKDIDAAKAAGDAETYESLTKRYAAWAEQYLREDR